MAECMDPQTRQTWTVNRQTCQACLVLEVEQENDAEAARSGRRSRGRKYAVTRNS